jgi:hypothetical protein
LAQLVSVANGSQIPLIVLFDVMSVRSVPSIPSIG